MQLSSSTLKVQVQILLYKLTRYASDSKEIPCSEFHACSNSDLGEFLLDDVVFSGKNRIFPLDFLEFPSVKLSQIRHRD